MGFQEMVERHLSSGYERLTSGKENAERPRKCTWVKKMNGRFKGFRVTRSKRLNWKAFSVLIMPRRICGIYADIVKRLAMEGTAHPEIVFSCQWGLPVLSHSTVSCRKSVISSYGRKPVLPDIVFAK